MRHVLKYLLFVLLIHPSVAQSTNAKNQILCEDAVYRRVQASQMADQQAYEDRQRELLEVPSSNSSSTDLKERRITVRKVDTVTLPEQDSLVELPLPIHQSFAESLRSDQRLHVGLSLHATVYGDLYSELTLTFEEDQFTVWTNMNLNYLRPIGRFQTQGRVYTYFGSVDNVSLESERRNAAFAESRGSLWREPPVSFAPNLLEYVLVTEDAADVPQEVYRLLDDVVSYYRVHEKVLRVDYLNAKRMEVARKRFKEANPEVPKDVMLNYSRVSEASKSR